ncbi:hypothetical protein GCM10025868_44760 [Angustibacter aerolatus]|uniref:Uncharacterized protein n=1 Tax=Angustibacter aerolatus TaxID=1162965 RepID=A0ABQ6JRB1_9ACTN|nr:hypothetical protein GCM10025868_44760 [Angustibacter aerolatus]
MPPNDDSPVQSDAGVTAAAPPDVAPSSACTTEEPVRWYVVPVRASARARGSASSASIVSSPWMVDSAPLLRFTRPSASTPSNVTPVAGSYVRAPDRLAPKNHPAARPASSRSPVRPVSRAAASSDCTRASAPYAICARSTGVGSSPLSGPSVVSSHGVKPAVSDTAARVAERRTSPTRVAPAAADSPAGICAPHACQSARLRPHGSTAPNGQCVASPPCSAATPSARRSIAVRARAEPPARTYADNPSSASALASPPSAINQRGTCLPSTTW